MADRLFSEKKIRHLVAGYRRKLELMNIPITKVYLYGSYAKKQANSHSDLDICVISPAFKDRIESTMTLMKIRDDDELVLSPIAFSPGSFVDENPLAWEIKETGVLM